MPPSNLHRRKSEIKKRMSYEIGTTSAFYRKITYSKLFLDLIQTVGADTLAIKEYDVIRVVAEHACRVVFLQDDAVIIGEDLDRVLDLDVHCFADLDRKNDSSQLVDFSDHSR